MGGILTKNEVILYQDINLLEFPFWTIENKKDQHCFVVETKQGKYTFFALPDMVPNHKDALFLYFFLYLAQELNTNELKFNTHNFLKNIGLPPNKKNYDDLYSSLKKWKSCSMEFEKCFVEVKKVVQNGKKVTITKNTDKGFGILKYERASVEKKYEGQTKTYKKHDYKVTLDTTFLQAIKDSNFKINFNIKTFVALKDPLRRRFFEWLPKQLVGRDKFVISDKLLFPKLLVERPKYMSLVERKLKTYKTKINQLNKYIEFYNYAFSWMKKKDDFQLVFSKSKKTEKEQNQQELFDNQKEKDFAEVVYNLEALGFVRSEEYSRKLAAKKDWDLAFADLNFEREKRERNGEAFNAGGWLRTVIDDNQTKHGTKYVPTVQYQKHLETQKKKAKAQKQASQKNEIQELENLYKAERKKKIIAIIEDFSEAQRKAEEKDFADYMKAKSSFDYQNYKKKGLAGTQINYQIFVGDRYLKKEDNDFILWAKKYHQKAVVKNTGTGWYEFEGS